MKITSNRRNKQLMQKKFMEILTKASCLSIEEQREYLLQFFAEWKRETEQTDDVCVVGIKI
jgi:serine phosphatase RsbU (regulator of sigma subunit)